MGEVVEIFSDSSSDTILTPVDNEDLKHSSFEKALSALNEIEGILKKYQSVEHEKSSKDSDVLQLEKCSETVATLVSQDSFQSCSTVSSTEFRQIQIRTEGSPLARKAFKYVLSDSEEEELYVPLEKRLNLPVSNEYRRSSSQSISNSESQETRHKDGSHNSLQTGPLPKKNRKASKEDKQATRLEKHAKQQKKEELQREKAIKQAVQNANRNLKPDQAMKFIKVHLDDNIMKSDFHHDIKLALDNLEIAHTFQPQVVPDIITWTRQVQSHDIDDSGKLGLSNKVIETDELLMVLSWRNVVELVSKGSLVSHIQSVKSVYANKKISLVIFGLQKYYNYQKSLKRKEFRGQMTDTLQGNVKDSALLKDVPIVSKQEIECLLTELQILCNLSCRRLETNSDVGLFVAQFSKAIAQLPYKLEKQKKQQDASWYMSGDNKDCVKVDKDGNGLNRLWHQQLTTFPLARLETAEAIANKYSTPLFLMQAYDECATEEEAQTLLQDIPIRRAAGPLTSVRKIGPEMSRKIYKFFTSLDEETLL